MHLAIFYLSLSLFLCGCENREIYGKVLGIRDCSLFPTEKLFTLIDGCAPWLRDSPTEHQSLPYKGIYEADAVRDRARHTHSVWRLLASGVRCCCLWLRWERSVLLFLINLVNLSHEVW